MHQTILSTDFIGFAEPTRGKVRDIYDLGERILMVATDRISAFDVILPNGIPAKGEVLNRISEFWFRKTEHIIPNHMISTDPEDFPDPFGDHAEALSDRSMLVKKTDPLPVECVVRGYISGSGWEEYKKTGSVCGIPLGEGLLESQKLPEPVFTPSTKAEQGTHDENITFAEVREMIGGELASRVRDASIEIYTAAAGIAEERGIIIADTKFEFGIDRDTGELILIDEALTPDSSRFWPRADYAPGGPQTSFDKQFVRDYLKQTGWNRNPPAPELPPDIVRKTSEKYLEMLRLFCGG
ncbi:MAG: phosphoribosylaminoimidazolesuccinocarboxamide synthase [Candidatus Dadabacteria bacterium]|nr:phosphoribosylaminoimidazolesuccinocarboxamide synthase [Candidatus Dadabacteria bacterium]MYC39622.1 phosphoribosylaminoimidazolesuccinocarboxamide synthase [Candidatus Dadabacteria bacterium]